MNTKKPPQKKCCENQHKGKCKIHSKIKMQVMLKHGNDHLKIEGNCPTFYNFVKENRKLEKTIIEIMFNRLEKYFTNKYNVIQFRNNQTGALIFEYRGK